MPTHARGLSSGPKASDFVTSFMADADALGTAAGGRSPWEDERDPGMMDVAATQVLQEDEEVEGNKEEKQTVVAEAPAPAVQEAASPQKSEQEPLTAEQRFVRAFDTIWTRLEASGWQIARGPDTMFCAMPGVQFFNFRPNMNVFDSKEKACWKFIAQAREQPDSADEAVVWDTLWPIAEQHFGWFTMQCGPETMFIKPGTRFEDFKPNETIFQTKKGAVLKCLAAEVGKIELGDSIEGHQVITFEAEKPKPKPKPKLKLVAAKEDVEHTPAHSSAQSFKTPSPKMPKKLPTPGSSKSKYITPPTKRSIASASSSSSKKKLASSSASKKKLKPKAKAKAKKAGPTLPEKDPNAFVFQEPPFRISFGLVYQRLQDIGWYHRSGQFEYDYFSPTYDKATAVLNRDFFQSQAEFENFLRSSGLWHKVEAELRAEHDEYVAEIRDDAKEKHHKQLAQAAKRKKQVSKMSTALKAPEDERPPAKKAKSVAKKPSTSALKKPVATGGSPRWMSEISAFRQEAEHGHPAVTIGRVTKKLVARGWTYRPGRFEYDYFKPGVTNKKTARLNEDYFESTADLELHLKMTGLWDRIAREIEDDHFAKQQELAIQMSQEEGPTTSEKAAPGYVAEEETKESDPPSQALSQLSSQSLSQSQPPSQSPSQPEPLSQSQSQSQPAASATPPRHPHLKRKASPPPLASLSSPGVKKPRSPGINKRDVQALTNEIWANSHEFDFDE